MKYIGKYTTEYSSKKYDVGTIFPTDSFGPLKILGRVEEGIRSDLFAVEFLSTGYITQARTSSIKKGMVKDYYVPTLYGRGFMGNGSYESKENGKVRREYKLWTGMFYRCYSNDKQYNNYKLKGVVVCERWFNYQTFCKDIINLEGYIGWVKGYLNCIDKDYKFNGTYSPESCKFISLENNSRESSIRNRLAEKGKKTRFTPSKK